MMRVVTPLLPEERMQRSDNNRVTLGKTPMMRHLRAQWSSFPPSDLLPE